MDLYTAGLPLILDPNVILMMILGTTCGVLIGALPGLTATIGVAVMTPLTFGMAAIPSFALLLSVYCGATFGGSITSVLAKIPGTPANMMTAIDGYPLGQKGHAGKAIGLATISSFIGGIVSTVVLALFAPKIASMALEFSAQEYFSIAMLGISIIAYISGKSMTKSLISGLLGLLVAVVGMDSMTGVQRFTFGNYELLSGVELIPALIGVFGLSEVLRNAAKGQKDILVTKQISKILPSKQEFKLVLPTIFRGTAIGTFIGAVPAVGGVTASIVAYGIEKRISKTPDEFGKGSLRGIAAPESANNSATGGAMIPMLTLGIPGDAVTAVLIGSLMLHGLTPGPLMFKNEMPTVSAIFILMALANVAFLFIGLLGARYVAKILAIPNNILMPVILLLCCVGTYGIRNSIFDLFVLLIFGAVGFLFDKIDVPSAPLVLGLVLGKLIEDNFRRTLALSNGNSLTVFTRPISCFFLVATLLILCAPIIVKQARKIFKGNSAKQEV
ncbi:MAG: tripartite tricarboxylate transporter permease [Clostridiales bacterium]|jgi:putative tricarboxylic transport membrane protein|nr:tripartite tricarboxylate transporter permease [Clostridiales bacterium]